MCSSLELRKSNILSKHWMFCTGSCAGSAVVSASLLTSFHAFQFGSYWFLIEGKIREVCHQTKAEMVLFWKRNCYRLRFFF